MLNETGANRTFQSTKGWHDLSPCRLFELTFKIGVNCNHAPETSEYSSRFWEAMRWYCLGPIVVLGCYLLPCTILTMRLKRRCGFKLIWKTASLLYFCLLSSSWINPNTLSGFARSRHITAPQRRDRLCLAMVASRPVPRP